MSSNQPYPEPSAESCIEFDYLCDLCASLFDESADWPTGYPTDKDRRPHHDISALASSAAYGCHICSLLFGDIRPEDIKRLQQDLCELVTPPSRQIGITITGESYFEILLEARGSALLPHPNYSSARRGWSTIALLKMQYEESDVSSATRSKAVSNCSDTTIAQITRWIDRCLTSHHKCFEMQTVAATRDILPKRLLDISSATTTGRVSLVSTSEMPQNTLYVTLSHCWGGNCGTMLTVDNMMAFENGVQVSDLAQTFQDAISITTKLSLRYLWVDALCIVQDSPNAVEWNQEASKMGDIYANSYVTVSATTSENSSGGLLHRRNPLSVCPCKIVAKWTCFKPGRLEVSIGEWSRVTDMKPLEDRALAFQEWLLSKRLVHFSHDQVRWECYCLAASQIYPEGFEADNSDDEALTTKTNILSLSEDKSRPELQWMAIREEYSGKQLTKASDRLAAFSGIARMAHKVLKLAPEEYCVGLMKPRLLTELLWTRTGRKKEKQSSEVYIAPSWSWASLNDTFDFVRFFGPASGPGGRWLFDVIETKIQYISDVFGSVNGGCLVSRCHLYPVILTAREDFDPVFQWKLSEIDGACVEFESRGTLDYHDPEDWNLPSTESCYFMSMYNNPAEGHGFASTVTGMLLQPTGVSAGQYHRIGILRLYLRREADRMRFMVQTSILAHPKLYMDDEGSGLGRIEIV